MNPHTKKPLLPKIAVPMHESSAAFKSNIERDEVPDDPDIQTALRGIDKVDSHLERINSVRSAILNDRTLTDVAKKAEFLKFTNKIRNQFYKDIDNVAQIVDRKTNAIHQTISRPISEEEAGRFGDEIRRKVASMDNSQERYKFVKKRIDNGQFEAASAVLGPHSYLADLSDEIKDALLDYYKSVRFADQMKVDKVMKKIGDSMLHKMDMIERFKKELSGEETVAALHSQEAREQAVNGS